MLNWGRYISSLFVHYTECLCSTLDDLCKRLRLLLQGYKPLGHFTQSSTTQRDPTLISKDMC